ncbi:MAG: asparagine synthase (glutamine-hydrolyzing) [Nitrospinaceae bacterium]
MCGISAIVAPHRPAPANAIEQMVASLHHRGPDERGVERLRGCELGHTRLAVIDLTGGHQPMSDASHRYWITYNGELYNFRELRHELTQNGYSFKTHSDTEVVLAAYKEWGVDCLHRFRGMFAFALWDAELRKLFAARDLFGEKPLYYAEAPGGLFLAASEIKASGVLSLQLAPAAVDAFLALGYLPPDRTIYENVRTLRPGCWLEWSRGAVRTEPYWRPRLETQKISLEGAADRVRELMRAAVRRQLVADVPVGSFLSGGLDSSSIVGLMAQDVSHPVKTFSVGFGKLINELPYARAVAEKYKTDHYELDLGALSPAEPLEEMARIYDEPFADSANVPTYLISQFARQHIKVVLNGDGGDELFGGYGWYPPLVLSERVPASWWLWVVLRSVSKLLRHRLRTLYLYSSAMGMAARWPGKWMRHVMGQVYFRVHDRAALWRGRPAPQAFSPGDWYRPPAGVTCLNQGFFFDLTSYLPGDILVKVDRAAMANSLETRAPFLDQDLVEFALSLPENLKVRDHERKLVLREACGRYWPEALRTREKQGFGAPYAAWLKLPEVRAMVERVFSQTGRLQALLPGLKRRRSSLSQPQVWILFVLGLWMERQEVEL